MNCHVKRVFQAMVLTAILSAPVLSAGQASATENVPSDQGTSVVVTMSANPDNWAWD